MIDGTEKPKIPLKFAKRTARYNEFRYNVFIAVAVSTNESHALAEHGGPWRLTFAPGN